MKKITLSTFAYALMIHLFLTYSANAQTPNLQAVTEAGSSTDRSIFLWGATNASGLRLQYGAGASFWVNTPTVNCMSIGGTGAPVPTSGALNILNNGNIGIGTIAPQSKLAVAGTITAQKIKVTATGWPDFVFHENYHLPSLQEVEKYILTHKHLPEMPSATTVENEGQDLGEINKKLLQKIEELTLYLINQQKDIDQQRKEIAALKEWKDKITAR